MKFTDRTSVCSEDKDSCDDASIGNVTFFRQTHLGFEFRFWLDRFRTFTSRNWGVDYLSLTLCLKCVLLIIQGRDQVYRLCWWENTNRTKNFIYSSLTLSTWDKMKLMLCALFNCNLGGKIRRLSMNIAFQYIWLKGLNFLTNRRIIYFYINLYMIMTMRSRKWC